VQQEEILVENGAGNGSGEPMYAANNDYLAGVEHADGAASTQ